MKEITEIVWYEHLDWSAIWVCVIAILVHLVYLKINKNKEITKYHCFFYALSGVLVLSFINEMGLPTLKYFIELPIELEGSIVHFLAAISGLGGGYVATRIIKMFQKKTEN